MKSLPKMLLLHTPTAGAKHPSADELMACATQAGLHPTYISTKDKRYKDALRKSWDLVIVAGGDGTVGRLVRELEFLLVEILNLNFTGGFHSSVQELSVSGQ